MSLPDGGRTRGGQGVGEESCRNNKGLWRELNSLKDQLDRSTAARERAQLLQHEEHAQLEVAQTKLEVALKQIEVAEN